MKKSLLLTAVGIVLTLFVIANSARAAIVHTDENNWVVWIEDLEVDSTTYDIDFEWGSYDSIFGPDFDPYSALAWDVRNEIVNVLNGVLPNPPNLITDPPTGMGSSMFLIPYGIVSEAEVAVVKGEYWKYWDDWHGVDGLPENWSRSSSWIWATFEGQGTSVVPIPGAVWLLGSGLIALVGFRRKFKR